MPKKEVFYTTFKTSFSENLLQKLKRLLKAAGFDHPDTDWRTCLDHCEKIGLGYKQYNLVQI